MRDNQQKWSSVSLSSNGQHIVISEYNGNIYKTVDYGTSWIKENLNISKWNSINISKNALFFLAAGGKNNFPSTPLKRKCALVSRPEQIENLVSWIDANDTGSMFLGSSLNNINEISGMASWIDANDTGSMFFGSSLNNINEISGMASWIDANDTGSMFLGSSSSSS